VNQHPSLSLLNVLFGFTLSMQFRLALLTANYILSNTYASVHHYLLTTAHAMCKCQLATPQTYINFLGSLLANQTAAKGVVTSICQIEIRKMVKC